MTTNTNNTNSNKDGQNKAEEKDKSGGSNSGHVQATDSKNGGQGEHKNMSK